MMIQFSLEGKLPTLNEELKKAKGHWGAYASTKRKVEKRIRTQIAAQGVPEVKEYPVKIEVTWICGTKHKRDLDNVSLGLKYIQDALVASKIIKDDNYLHIAEITHKYEYQKDYFGQVVKIIYPITD